jgi:tRNA (guanine-N7-)-methyltransferase
MAASPGRGSISSISSSAPSPDAAPQRKRGGPPDDPQSRWLYGRRLGRRLRPAKRAALERGLAELALPLPPEGALLDLREVFGVRPVWLEIGFGAGEHLLAQARANPEVAIIGCEPFLNGLASMLEAVEREGLGAIRVFADDARQLLRALPPASLARVFLLFPDPWPKARHAKRRFVQTAILDRLASLMCDGAELRIASDDPGYQLWALRHLLAHPDFAWTAARAADWLERPADWPATRYEAKALAAGRQPIFLRFRRRARVAGRLSA